MDFRFAFTAGVPAVALATPKFYLGQTDNPCRIAGRVDDDYSGTAKCVTIRWRLGR